MEAEAVRHTLRQVLKSGLVRIAGTSDTARAFTQVPSRLTEEVLIRHWIEHVFRIRLFRPLDVLATQQIARTDPRAAETWGRYARSEAVHDRYFLRDLKAIGLDRSAVEGLQPFDSTLELVRFVTRAAKAYGPVAVVLYSFWAEENSDVGSAAIIDRTGKLFGREAVRGASAHRSLDENLDHAGVISEILGALIRDDDALCAAAAVLDRITSSIAAYFLDLDVWQGHPAIDARLIRGADMPLARAHS